MSISTSDISTNLFFAAILHECLRDALGRYSHCVEHFPNGPVFPHRDINQISQVHSVPLVPPAASTILLKEKEDKQRWIV
eukprot:g63799.t1